jgi:Ca-activated chloride channel family protein
MNVSRATLVPILVAAALAATSAQEPQNQDGQSFRFKSGVELINVTATVSDGRGHFVSGLGQEDFRVYEDGEPREITHFTSERVPVSLGIVLDTSGSMEGEKMLAARQALQRFLFDLLGPDDEFFLYRFDSRPERVSGWTTDRQGLAAELRRIQPRGATTLYDAIAEAVPLAATGRHRKKALLIISDGNDTSSFTRISELKRMIRETEVLVYAIGIDGTSEVTGGVARPQPPIRIPLPFPMPGRRRPWPGTPGPGTPGPGPSGGWTRSNDRVNAAALRAMTDDSGGRTEIVRGSRDLEPATAGIADELSRQYFLAYPAAADKDGRWHTIRVEVRDKRYRVRARQGYTAS